MTNEFHQRTFTIDFERDHVDADLRTVEMGVSSEEPVYRAQFGRNEVLDHSPDSIDMGFMQSKTAPLLLGHDPDDQIGVIESFYLDQDLRRTKAVARFSRSAKATEIFNDVLDGIRRNISVGYTIQQHQRDTVGGEDVQRVTRWTPLEASITAIPADQSTLVGVGRSQTENLNASDDVQPIETETHPEEVIITMEDNRQDTETLERDAFARGREQADERSIEIANLGEQFEQTAMANEAIRTGVSVTDFKSRLLEAQRNQVHVVQDDDIGLTNKETRKFSLTRWINAQANPNDRRLQELAAFEREAVTAATEQRVYGGEGSQMPGEVYRSWSQRDINTSDDAGAIGTEFLANGFIDALRARSSVLQAGATVLDGLNADVKIPKATSASSAGWVSSEGGNTSESEMVFSSITLSPKTAGVFTEVTGQMMAQGTGAGAIGIENIIRNDILSSTTLLVDSSATGGTGSSGQPTGLNGTTGVNSESLATANTLTFADAVNMESLCLADNAVFGNAGYLLTSTQVGLAKQTVKESGQASYVMTEGGEINGHRVYISNNIGPAGTAYFSVDWSQLLVAYFGAGPSLLVDPYTGSASGTVRIRVIMYADIGVRVPQAFCKASA
tara:strand:- start:654 stop:2501 length:1848 start_codon:yes stop_codon:yes gene_type:complete